MISAHKLTKVFGGKVAVDGVTFEVEKGEILGFLGPNAAGKTTTMRMLTGYFPPTSGTATIAGFDVSTDSMKVRREIGYLLFQTIRPLFTVANRWRSGSK